eukprot:TRINITY_DN3245_c1_g1_i1.p1 TRINITY_DN3245_c1_g1~~TRINITY_DN3245_c1_g1_i1.p1  ORF type:complete len:341 (-),score=24.34 TRINITY_DN3245_c1_g1_i1:237-1259(-)
MGLSICGPRPPLRVLATCCTGFLSVAVLLGLVRRATWKSPARIGLVSDNPARIGLVSDCHYKRPAGQQMCEVTLANFRKYCEKWGYRPFLNIDINETKMAGRDRPWAKVLLILSALGTDGIDYVFWSDADSLIMDFSRPLDEFLPTGDAQLTVTGDSNCVLNSGHMLLKRSEWTTALLEEVWSTFPGPEPRVWAEQTSMIWILTGRQPRCRADVDRCCRDSFLPEVHVDAKPGYNDRRSTFNIHLSQYEPGDFIIHTAGMNPNAKLRSIKRKLWNVSGEKAQLFAQLEAQQIDFGVLAALCLTYMVAALFIFRKYSAVDISATKDTGKQAGQSYGRRQKS